MSAKSQPPTAARQPQPAVSARTPAAGSTGSIDAKKLDELTRQIAYELYEKRGKQTGRALDDWLEAEKVARTRLQART